MAIAAGVDTIEHASYLDDAGIAAALKRGNVALAMDVYNGDYIDTEGRRAEWPEEFLRKNTETTEIQRQAFTKAVKAGVPIVFATDAGVFPHGLNARQFPIMVARGMTPDAGHQVGDLRGGTLHGLERGRGHAARPESSATSSPCKAIRCATSGACRTSTVVVKGGLLFKLEFADC